jgi:hypothetical protein
LGESGDERKKYGRLRRKTQMSVELSIEKTQMKEAVYARW